MAVWMCKHGEWVKCHEGCAFVQKDMLNLTRHYKTAHNGIPVPYDKLVIIQDVKCEALMGAAAFKKLKKDPKNEWPANVPYPPRPRSKGSLATVRASPHVRSAQASARVASTDVVQTASNGQAATHRLTENSTTNRGLSRNTALSTNRGTSLIANESLAPDDRRSINSINATDHAQLSTHAQAPQPSTSLGTSDSLPTDSQASPSADDEEMLDAPPLSQITTKPSSDFRNAHTADNTCTMDICEAAGNTKSTTTPTSIAKSNAEGLTHPARKAHPSLLGIPSELRNSIYRYTIGPVTRWESDIFMNEKEDFSLALTRVSRQLRVEVVRFLSQTFTIVRLRVDTKRDARGMRAGIVAQAFGEAPLFLMNPELQTDIALPKLTPLLHLKMSIENPVWSETERVISYLDASTSTGEPDIEQEELDEAYDDYVDMDITSEEPFNTWVKTPDPSWCGNGAIRQRYTQELTFLFSRESLDLLLSELYHCCEGDGIEQFDIDFAPGQLTPTQTADRQKIISCLSTSINAPDIKITGLPFQESDRLQYAMTHPGDLDSGPRQSLEVAVSDLSRNDHISASLASRWDCYTLSDHFTIPSATMNQGGAFTDPERHLKNREGEVLCLLNLVCTKAHNRRLQNHLASGALAQLAPIGLQRALQSARYTYAWIGLTDAQRADAYWECGLLHRFLAQCLALPNNNLSGATPSPAITTQWHWKSSIHLMILALRLGHPRKQQIRNTIRHIMGNVDIRIMYELLEISVRGGRRGDGVTYVWMGTAEESDRIKPANAPCELYCPCLKHITKLRERPDSEETGKVAELSSTLLNLYATLPEDHCTAEGVECQCGLVTEVLDYRRPAKYERFKHLIG